MIFPNKDLKEMFARAHKKKTQTQLGPSQSQFSKHFAAVDDIFEISFPVAYSALLSLLLLLLLLFHYKFHNNNLTAANCYYRKLWKRVCVIVERRIHHTFLRPISTGIEGHVGE